MKFIWYSVAPWAASGYGLVTRELVPRIAKEGHEVIITTKHAHTGRVKWKGFTVISGTDISLMNRMVESGEVDYIISLIDNHILPINPKNWISYTPFDTEKLPLSIAKTLEYPKLIIALTKHGQNEFKKAGFDSFYAPHGVDPDIYCPNEVRRQKERKRLEWEDNFIVGTVGVNYSDDRKNFVNLMWAFKVLHERHPEARLYMATNHVDPQQAYPISMIAEGLKITDYLALTSDDDYMTGKISDDTMADRYRLMDVMCMPTKGEGFGLPLIESQACGTPAITTNASTGPELMRGGWLIEVGKYDWEYFNKSWRSHVRVESILNSLEEAFEAWKDGSIKEIGERASAVIRTTYDWDFIFDKYWKPILREIEGLRIKVRDTPNYRKLYKSFNGRITMSDCGRWCKQKCDDGFNKLPGEIITDRNILSRSYPLRPDRNGELCVDTACPLHRWLGKGFVLDAKRIWKELWGYPVIRKFFDSPAVGLPLDSIKYNFDDSYKGAIQGIYYTICPDLSPYINGAVKVLDIGCGAGERVSELRAKGIDAIGVEINDAWLKDYVVKGDAENLDFPDDSFDVVLSVDLLEHLENPLKGLSEMFRVSRDKVIAMITPVENPDFWQDPTHKVEWDRERWKRELNEFGKITDVLEPFGFVVKKR